jgi:uncharacterized protein (DUF433 family)
VQKSETVMLKGKRLADGFSFLLNTVLDIKIKPDTTFNAMNRASENPKNFDSRIVRDKAICEGESVFKGTRVTLRTVLASLAAGDSAEEILSDFPSLKREDIQAAIAFAAASAEEDLPIPPVPQVR